MVMANTKTDVSDLDGNRDSAYSSAWLEVPQFAPIPSLEKYRKFTKVTMVRGYRCGPEWHWRE